MKNSLVKQEDWKRALQNLSEAHQAGAKDTQKPLQSSKRADCSNEDGKSWPQEVFTLSEGTRL